jgi:hypothetical protein
MISKDLWDYEIKPRFFEYIDYEKEKRMMKIEQTIDYLGRLMDVSEGMKTIFFERINWKILYNGHTPEIPDKEKFLCFYSLQISRRFKDNNFDIDQFIENAYIDGDIFFIETDNYIHSLEPRLYIYKFKKGDINIYPNENIKYKHEILNKRIYEQLKYLYQFRKLI